jgi:hypothetical protein
MLKIGIWTGASNGTTTDHVTTADLDANAAFGTAFAGAFYSW